MSADLQDQSVWTWHFPSPFDHRTIPHPEWGEGWGEAESCATPGPDLSLLKMLVFFVIMGFFLGLLFFVFCFFGIRCDLFKYCSKILFLLMTERLGTSLICVQGKCFTFLTLVPVLLPEVSEMQVDSSVCPQHPRLPPSRSQETHQPSCAFPPTHMHTQYPLTWGQC